MRILPRKPFGARFFLALGAALALSPGVRAETDMQLQEKALKAREQSQHGGMDHGAHGGAKAAGEVFRGVFYGYLPCHEPDCDGIKMTLSLNARNKYLLVIQPAKSRNRESFEKGRYEWDEQEAMVVLTPNGDGSQRRLAIKDSGTLLYLTPDGAHLSGDQARYLLQRSDQANNREMHIH